MIELRLVSRAVQFFTGPSAGRVDADCPTGRLLAALEPHLDETPRPPVRGVSRHFRIGEVTFRLRPRTGSDRAVVLEGLRSLAPRSGQATEVMRLLCTLADRSGTALVLDVGPFATPAVPEPMPAERLAAWYARFGFLPTVGMGLRREPHAG
jgi:hypothetical protein